MRRKWNTAADNSLIINRRGFIALVLGNCTLRAQTKQSIEESFGR